ncbi:uncharacterized protein [Haliaeetus albicilla]|uniref:uncharacterized protein n=1 Tax=Haliaeetus albicilla TaxID=8969 RepID=UPI0037E7CF52
MGSFPIPTFDCSHLDRAHAETNLKHCPFSCASLQRCFPAPRSCGPRRASTRDRLGAATNTCHELRSPHGLVSGTRGGWLWAAEAAGDPGTTRRVQHFPACILTPPCWLAWPRLKRPIPNTGDTRTARGAVAPESEESEEAMLSAYPFGQEKEVSPVQLWKKPVSAAGTELHSTTGRQHTVASVG